MPKSPLPAAATGLPEIIHLKACANSGATTVITAIENLADALADLMEWAHGAKFFTHVDVVQGVVMVSWRVRDQLPVTAKRGEAI